MAPSPGIDPARLSADLLHTFRTHKALAESALAQVSDGDFLQSLPGATNALAVTVKHVGGNLRSRWRDFLASDGEKPDRHRDGEFELKEGEGRDSVLSLWEAGWAELFGTLESLQAVDWARTVTIRGEAHSVSQAALRSLAHTSYHVGQIVDGSRRAAGDAWKTLSIPRGQSEAFGRNPSAYLAPPSNTTPPAP